MPIRGWLRAFTRRNQPTSLPRNRRPSRTPRVEELESRLLLVSSLSISDAMVVEGQSGVTNLLFTVTRTGDLNTNIVAGYATSSGTATAGSDYIPQTGTIEFTAGATTSVITIAVVGDTVDEDDETFQVNITSVSTVGPPATFAPRADFSAGNNFGPYSVVSPDINGDGRPDLVTANRNGAGVSVLLNSTSPGATTASFAARQQFATNGYSLRLATGDLNGDGKPDVVTANYTQNNNVAVLLNTTAPGSTTASFAPRLDLTSPVQLRSVALGDFNSDGKLDLATASDVSSTLSIFVNTTAPGSLTPTFAPRQDIPMGFRGRQVWTADFNNDGRMDCATVTGTLGNTIKVYLNTTTAGGAVSFATGVPFSLPANCRMFASGDLNNDGRPDLAAASSAGITVLLNTTAPGAGTPSFTTPVSFNAGNNAEAITLGDFNSDGKLDAVTANFGASPLSGTILLNKTVPGSLTPLFGPRQDYATQQAGPLSVTTADYNLDGKTDYAVINNSPGTVSVFLNTTTLPSVAPALSRTSFPVLAAPVALATVDINADGRPDLAVANRDSERVSVLLNTTAPGATLPTYSPRQDFFTGSEPHGIAVADINFDGLPDLAVSNRNSGTVTILFNTTTAGASAASFQFQTNLTGEDRPRGVTFTDVNGDGKPDLVVVNENFSNRVSVRLNMTVPGSFVPTFSARQTFAVGDGAFLAAVADINGDGRPDLVVNNDASGSVSVLLNTTLPGATSPSFSHTHIVTVGPGIGAPGLAVGDVNGDGRPDVVATDYTANTVSLLVNTTPLGDATPSFLPRQVFSTGPAPRWGALGDINGDGRLDLITTTSDPEPTASIGVRLNITMPGSMLLSFATRQDFLSGSGGMGVAVVDLNSDGRLDLAAADRGSNTASVLLNTPATILDGQGIGTIVDDDPVSLRVDSLTQTPTGFAVRFNQTIDPNVVNLYDTETGGLGDADVTLTRTGVGPIQGSLVLDSDNRGFTFLQTGGLLATGAYSVVLRSATNGFKNATVGLLDGNSDGTPGDNFTTTFNVAASTARVVSVPDFARGPGQVIDVPATSSGIPLDLNDGTGVTSVEVTLRFDPALLTITGVTLNPALGEDAKVTATSGPGRLTLNVTSPTPLGPGPVRLLMVNAQVPLTAPYASKGVLDLTDLRINQGTITGVDDDGLHLAAYFGDTSGNHAFSALDAQRTLRVSVGFDRGFLAYRNADPVIVADINGNGQVTALDAVRIQREGIGIDQAEIPAIPAGVTPTPATGPDPLLNFPVNVSGRPGDTFVVPLRLDLSDGLETGDLAISYDTTRLEVVNNEVRKGTLTNDFDLFLANVDPVAGTIRVGLGRTGGPIAGRGSGSVIEMTFRIKAGAPTGAGFINLRRDQDTTLTQLNEGGLVLNPAPNNTAGDTLDGLITVAPASVLPRVETVLINGGSAQRSQVTSVSVIFNTVVRFRSLPVKAFTFLGPRGAVGRRAVVTLDATGTKTIVHLFFGGSKTSRGSVTDGRYRLIIDGDQIFNAAGTAVDGDGNGVAGGDAVSTFFRLYGDSDGDADVDAVDQAAFNSTFLKRSTDPAYLAYFDLNGNRIIDYAEQRVFRRWLGKRV